MFKKFLRETSFCPLTLLCHRPAGTPAPLENLAEILSTVLEIPQNFSLTGKFTLITSPFKFHCKKLHSKTIPTGFFKLGTIEYAHWDYNGKLYPPCGKSFTGALRQGCKI